VLLLAGIARPGGFRRTLAALGAEVAAEAVFPDHHRFAPADVEGALRAADAARCELVVTTEKDAVRLPPAAAADPRIRAVRIEAEIVRGGGELEAALDAALGAPAARPVGAEA
jgi:tetraacyldisaccharide 4'-kinase